MGSSCENLNYNVLIFFFLKSLVFVRSIVSCNMYVFSFFREFAPALHLAVSEDLLHWSEINNEEPILEPMVGGKYWRDPFIIRDIQGTFHLLCTDGWSSPFICHAFSQNLINWSDQSLLHVMKNFPSSKNAWAPEACYNHLKQEYLIFWSSTVIDGFPEHKNKPKDYQNHRIYACTTKNFKEYSDPFLYLDPGYNVIDASMGFNGSYYLMAFKDERAKDTYFVDEKARKHILFGIAKDPMGPWDLRSFPISHSLYSEKQSQTIENPTEYWAEGPSVFWNNADQSWYVFYEYFRSHKYGCARSSDLVNWENLDSKVIMPPGVKHGTVFEVNDEEIIKKLQSKL